MSPSTIRIFSEGDNINYYLNSTDESEIQRFSSEATRQFLREKITGGEYDTVISQTSPGEQDLTGAYVALINSPIFARVEELASTSLRINTKYTNLVAGFSQGLAGAWLPEVVSVSIEKLAQALDQDGESFSQSEKDWLSGWNTDYNLALNFPWNLLASP